MKNVLYPVVLLMSMYATETIAQTTPFPTTAFNDINNIKAAVLVHGDMWNAPGGCYYPKDSMSSIASAGALWLAGYDAGNQLHISAQTYRQKGNDYWPGPLDASDTLTYSTSQKWADIWKINRTTLDSFRAMATHTAANTPPVILHWPAKGNPYATGNAGASLTINSDMAPFVDVDHDGIYNPLNGDYPDMKGDQMLWWVYSDNGPTHTESNGLPLKVEIHASAYAYSRGTLIDNVIYYEYQITNKSANDYHNFRIGQFADLDLGWAFDDFLGFDSALRLGFDYNSKATDPVFGTKIPIVGITMIQMPGDNAATGTYVPAGNFMYYNNDYSAEGSPSNGNQFNNYMRAIFLDGTHLKVDGHDTSSSVADANYAYAGLYECAHNDLAGDRRFVITSNDFTMAAGGTQTVVMALVTVAPDTGNACPDIKNTDKITTVADTAWNVFKNPPATVVKNIAATAFLNLYPNPAHNQLFIDASPNTPITSLIIYDALGRSTHPKYTQEQNKITVNVYGLPNGIYTIMYRNDREQKTALFVKQ